MHYRTLSCWMLIVTRIAYVAGSWNGRAGTFCFSHIWQVSILLRLKLSSTVSLPVACAQDLPCVTQAQANDSNPWLDKDGAPPCGSVPICLSGAMPCHANRSMTSCTGTDVTVSVCAGNPVERFDAIIMDRPWLFHWKKAFIFLPIQGLLIATGTAANRSILLLADGSVSVLLYMSIEPLDHAQAPWWGMRVTS